MITATPSAIACPSCLTEQRGQCTHYDFRCDWYVCPVHGPVVTGEYLAANLGEPEPARPYWWAA